MKKYKENLDNNNSFMTFINHNPKKKNSMFDVELAYKSSTFREDISSNEYSKVFPTKDYTIEWCDNYNKERNEEKIRLKMSQKERDYFCHNNSILEEEEKSLNNYNNMYNNNSYNKEICNDKDMDKDKDISASEDITVIKEYSIYLNDNTRKILKEEFDMKSESFSFDENYLLDSNNDNNSNNNIRENIYEINSNSDSKSHKISDLIAKDIKENIKLDKNKDADKNKNKDNYKDKDKDKIINKNKSNENNNNEKNKDNNNYNYNKNHNNNIDNNNKDNENENNNQIVIDSDSSSKRSYKNIIKKYEKNKNKSIGCKLNYLNDNNNRSNKNNFSSPPKNLPNSNISLKEIKEILDKSDLSIGESKIERFNLMKYKILVVDDNKILRQSLIFVISKFLKKRNLLDFYEIIECNDGVEIIHNLIKDQAENNLIKCVITDESMEYINGSEAIRILKNLENNNKIKPVIFAVISSFDKDYMRNVFNEDDLIYFLPKPCNEENFEIFFEVMQG